MKKRYIAVAAVGFLCVGIAVAAYRLAPTVHAGSATELPELGRPGAYTIATQVDTISLGERPIITATSVVTGHLDSAPRDVRVRLWYPSVEQVGDTAAYEHDLSRDPDDPLPVIFKGRALVAGTAITEQKFPLVVMSHGYGGWAEHFSFLGEHIASHGYVVASINHEDAPPGGAISFLLSFANVLQNRALDQYQVIAALKQAATTAATGYAASIDTRTTAVIGYSMGGFGAFRTAGAAYDYDGEGITNLPAASKAAMQSGTDKSAELSAMIALAPWGGAPDNRSWSAEGLRQLTVPTLIIAGNQDDVVDFEQGVQWLFDGVTKTDRQLLVYREARHNIAGNAITNPDFPANENFATAEYIREPVWRSERINAINQHFITAFLDLHLKNDTKKAVYLTPPTIDSNDSHWPTSPGEQLNGKLAGALQTSHWRGFQNRWALGMELHTKAQEH